MQKTPSLPPLSWRATAILILALLVRFIPMGRYVTPDEPIWVLRSVRFADALAARDWAAIPQTGHPGLTTMVVGALGIRLTEALYPAQSATHLAWIRNLAWLAPENSAAFEHLAFFLPASRALIVGITVLGVMLAYILARRTINERAARWLALCLALDPFLIGLSSLLHTDALQATFILLAVLFVSQKSQVTRRKSQVTRHTSHVTRYTFQVANRKSKIENQKSKILLSALCLALAGLTKTLGLLAAPGVAFALLLDRNFPWQRRVLRVIMLTALTSVFLLALYPPFWENPADAIGTLIGAVGYHEGIGNRDVFFLGQTRADPGPFFYPLVLLFRLTPPVALGLGLTLSRKFRTWATPMLHSAYIWLPLMSYIVPLSLVSKKFDRYVLTLIPLLTLLAVPALARWGRLKRGRILAALLWPWALVAPLPLMYANPIVGGPWVAQHVIPLGWSEASGIAATRATRLQPAAQTLLAANVPGSAPFFSSTVWPWRTERIACADTFIGKSMSLPDADVTHTHMYFAGLPLATLSTRTYTWPDTLTLLPGPLPGASTATVIPITDMETLALWVNANVPIHQPFLWIHAPDCYPLADAQFTALLQHNAAAVQCTSTSAVASFVAESCTRTAELSGWPFAARFDGTLDLIAATWPPTGQAPNALTVQLRWLPRAPVDTLDFHLALWGATEPPCGVRYVTGTPCNANFSSPLPHASVRYATGSNLLVDERGWASAAWDVAYATDGTAYIPLPLHLPPGTYTITLSLTDSAARQLGVTWPEGTFGGTRYTLGTIQIAAPPYPAPTLDLPLALEVSLSGLRLIGAAPPFSPHWAGDQLRFSLGWERLPGRPPADVRWSLTRAGLEPHSGTLSLTPETLAAWQNGQRYITQHVPRTPSLLDAGVYTLNISVGDTVVPLGNITVQARARRFSLERPPHIPLAVTVGDFAALVGADLPTRTVTVGHSFTMTVYWEAQAAPDLDYTVFVHLVDEAGKSWAQSDAGPENGSAPTTSWVAGQIIVDTHTLSLPADVPAGQYTLFVGLYDVGSGGRVPLYAPQQNSARLSDNRAPLGTIVVSVP